MAPISREIIIHRILNTYTYSGNIQYDLLINNTYRFINEDQPLIHGYTNRFKDVAERLNILPYTLEYAPLAPSVSSKFIQLIFLKIDYQLLIKCEQFLKNNY